MNQLTMYIGVLPLQSHPTTHPLKQKVVHTHAVVICIEQHMVIWLFIEIDTYVDDDGNETYVIAMHIRNHYNVP